MSRHTKEPWYNEEALHDDEMGGPKPARILAEGERVVYDPEGDEVKEADRRRIILCVNSCAGLDPVAYRQVVDAGRAILAASALLHGSLDAMCAALPALRRALTLVEQP